MTDRKSTEIGCDSIFINSRSGNGNARRGKEHKAKRHSVFGAPRSSRCMISVLGSL